MTTDLPFVTRFAPSPTGALHLGHAYSALVTYRAARTAGGTFLLRIEDTDFTRCKPAYEEAILEDLAWLGIRWDAPPLRQSDRRALYDAQLQRLIDQGLVYRCFRSRKEWAAMTTPPLGDPISAPLSAPHGPLPPPCAPPQLAPAAEQKLLAQGAPFSWRLSIAAVRAYLGEAADQLTVTEDTAGPVHHHPVAIDAFDGTILGRKDTGISYHLASVYDDDASGVTHIIRGEDLREAAGLHRLLYALFGATPPIYQHHKLILNEDGQRLAKRDHALSLAQMRADGTSANDLCRKLGLPAID